MKSRTAVALVTGALALGAVVVPAAHADDRSSARPVAAAPEDELKITDFVLNGGEKETVVGLRAKTIKVTFTAQYPKGIDYVTGSLWRGPSPGQAERRLLPYYTGGGGDEGDPQTCVYVSQTEADCTLNIVANPNERESRYDLDDANAGQWNLELNFTDYGEQWAGLFPTYATHSVKRAARLSADATPEPVRRGADLTVKGALSRVSWDKQWYAGFAADQVELQFKKSGGTWKTVKTVAADSRGRLKATVKASADGQYRFRYGGSATTGAVTSPADTVDVR
ncbi:calcium-binding protein [Streptomyces sp. JNUCC 64]